MNKATHLPVVSGKYGLRALAIDHEPSAAPIGFNGITTLIKSVSSEVSRRAQQQKILCGRQEFGEFMVTLKTTGQPERYPFVGHWYVGLLAPTGISESYGSTLWAPWEPAGV